MKGMEAFFANYVSRKLSKIPGKPSTNDHITYMNRFSNDTNVIVRGGYVSSTGAQNHIDAAIEHSVAEATKMYNNYEVGYRRPYIQSLDYRIYQDLKTKGGWCLGIVAKWLKTKLAGEDFFFGSEPYEDDWVKTVQKLMQNQSKMNSLIDGKKVGSLVKLGSLDIRAKNALDYIVGGRAHPMALTFSVKSELKIKANKKQHVRELLGKLEKYKKHNGSSSNLFLIAVEYAQGGAHAMGIELAGTCAFFDPNLGIMEPITSGDKETLLRFFFDYMLTKYKDVSSCQMFRCIPAK